MSRNAGMKLFRNDPFGKLRPNFACLRRSGFAQAGASKFYFLIAHQPFDYFDLFGHLLLQVIQK